jgi:hypothetical protein
MVIYPVYSKHGIPWTTAKYLPQALLLYYEDTFTITAADEAKIETKKSWMDGGSDAAERRSLEMVTT